MSTNKKPWAASSNDEDYTYHYTTKQDAISQFPKDADLSTDDIFYVAKLEQLDPTSLFPDTDWVIEQLSEEIQQETGIENWPMVTSEQTKSLGEEFKSIMSKFLKFTGNMKKPLYKVTQVTNHSVPAETFKPLRDGDFCRANCTAPARYIGNGLCIYISGRDNEIMVDKVGAKPHADSITCLPTDEDVRLASRVTIATTKNQIQETK